MGGYRSRDISRKVLGRGKHDQNILNAILKKKPLKIKIVTKKNRTFDKTGFMFKPSTK